MGFLAPAAGLPAAPVLSGGISEVAGILFGEAGGTERRLICTHTHQTRNTCWHSGQFFGWFMKTEGLTGVLAASGNVKGDTEAPQTLNYAKSNVCTTIHCTRICVHRFNNKKQKSHKIKHRWEETTTEMENLSSGQPGKAGFFIPCTAGCSTQDALPNQHMAGCSTSDSNKPLCWLEPP